MSNFKQIYVALQLSDNEINVLVGEYFNTRFNIIRCDSYDTNAISDFKINDKQQLVSDIENAINTSSEKIGSKIEKTILVLPAYNYKRFPLRSKVIVDLGIIKKSDIARAITNSLKANVDKDVMVVNPMVVKYTVNGISTRRLPENESSNDVVVDIDLLCADLNMCYDYVSAVEEAGLKVLDISLNTYSIAKEASLFEESLNRNVVILEIGRSCTYLSLLSKGKLISTEIVFDGLNSLINKLYRLYNIPYNDIAKLVKFNTNYDSEYLDDIIYAWNNQGVTRSLSTRMLNEAIDIPLNALTDKLVTMCKPIIEAGASIVITGEGEQMLTLCEMIKDKTESVVRRYAPETIGVRNPALTALYGSFIAYHDKVVMNDLSVSCIDLLKYDELIDEKQLDQEGETITTKIKNLFKQYIERGEN